jgi:hypothetical protein
MKTAHDFVQDMDDPDKVGSSEYRAIHEVLNDMCDEHADDPPEAQLKRLDTILDEFQGWAKAIQADIKKELDG